MQTVMYTSTVFGPIHSRRLGVSLGVNLMPSDGKVCTFDCLYCEAGLNAQGTGKSGLPSRPDVAKLLRKKLEEMTSGGESLDVITFSGNGEPTLHPDFEGVIDDTIELRDVFYPAAKVSVLSNATRAGREDVKRALLKVDNNILKLDSAIGATVQILDRPTDPCYSVAHVIEDLKGYDGKCIVQTMILRGEHGGISIDNTTDEEVAALIEAYKTIKPQQVMLYSIDRKTPVETLRKVERNELERIAARVAEAGICVSIA